MKLNVRKLNLFFLAIATIVPSYWFVSGRQILNIIYYIGFFLFIVQLFMQKSDKKISYGIVGIYIISLVWYCLQALIDTGFTTAINSFFASAMVVIAISYSLKTEKDFYQLIDLVLICSLPLLILGILEAFSGYNFFQHADLTLSGSTFYSEYRLGIFRVSSVFGHPIVYCNYLSIIAALLVYRLSCVLSHRKRILFRIIYALVLINVLLTVSRSVILVFIGVQVVLFAVKREKWFTTKKVFVIICITIILLISDLIGLGLLNTIEDVFNMLLQVFGLGSDTYSSEFSSIGYSDVTGDRWDLYRWVYESTSDNLLWGQGTTAQFSYMATEYREKTSIENYYLSMLFQHGFVGLIIMIVGLLALLFYIMKRVRFNTLKKICGEQEQKLTFNITMLCIILGQIVSYFMANQSGEVRLLYICIGALIAYNGLLKSRSLSNGC